MNKNILEIGCGTALPGILAAKCGSKGMFREPKIIMLKRRVDCEFNKFRLNIRGVRTGRKIICDFLPITVTLSDSLTLPTTLKNIHQACLLNSLQPGKDIKVIGLSWGVLLNNIFTLGPIDYIIASDVFYDPSVFEDILVTVSFLLERNPLAKFLFTYQVRSADWSIEASLKKWHLVAVNINIEHIGRESGIDVNDLSGTHTIHLLEITKG